MTAGGGEGILYVSYKMNDDNISPHYDLKELQSLVKNGCWTIPPAHFKEATEQGFSRTDIVDTVMSLTPKVFYKAMPSEKLPGLWQDVYKPQRNGIKLYVKLQKSYDGKKCVVISFKKAHSHI